MGARSVGRVRCLSCMRMGLGELLLCCVSIERLSNVWSALDRPVTRCPGVPRRRLASSSSLTSPDNCESLVAQSHLRRKKCVRLITEKETDTRDRRVINIRTMEG